jgi:hypothetical protein
MIYITQLITLTKFNLPLNEVIHNYHMLYIFSDFEFSKSVYIIHLNNQMQSNS